VYKNQVRDILEMIGQLGTWISITEKSSFLAFDPPELSYIHEKRITFIGSIISPLNLLRSRLYDGIIEGIVGDIL